ncbi:MAG: hypothetical protein BJ554DRAFT_6248, partial [Olpidium bornovanus]
MKDPVLRELTASEPLSLEEEYQMQVRRIQTGRSRAGKSRRNGNLPDEMLPSVFLDHQNSWHVDPQKCTFILYSPPFAIEPHEVSTRSFKAALAEAEGRDAPVMVGDVNIFISVEDGEEEKGEKSGALPSRKAVGEIEIMIAERNIRRKGVGLEATLLMLRYAITDLRLNRVYAKISRRNAASIEMFRSKLRFRGHSESEVFDEVTLAADLSSGETRDLVLERTKHVVWGAYDDDRGGRGPVAGGPGAAGWYTLREIPHEATYPLRLSVLWPDDPSQVPLPGDPGGVHFGAFVHGRDPAAPDGVISLFVSSSSSSPRSAGKVAAQFRKFATHPDVRGRGIGSALLDRVAEVARAKGAELLWCNARVEQRRFYEKRGMEVVPGSESDAARSSGKPDAAAKKAPVPA